MLSGYSLGHIRNVNSIPLVAPLVLNMVVSVLLFFSRSFRSWPIFWCEHMPNMGSTLRPRVARRCRKRQGGYLRVRVSFEDEPGTFCDWPIGTHAPTCGTDPWSSWAPCSGSDNEADAQRRTGSTPRTSHGRALGLARAWTPPTVGRQASACRYRRADNISTWTLHGA